MRGERRELARCEGGIGLLAQLAGEAGRAQAQTGGDRGGVVPVAEVSVLVSRWSHAIVYQTN